MKSSSGVLGANEERWLKQFETMSQVLAQRIAHNRVVAGIHFPSDSAAGKKLGDFLQANLTALGESLRTGAKTDSPFGWLWKQAWEEWRP